MRKELKDLKVHAYLGVTVVYGRRPGGRPKPHVEPSPGFTVHGMPKLIPDDYQGLA